MRQTTGGSFVADRGFLPQPLAVVAALRGASLAIDELELLRSLPGVDLGRVDCPRSRSPDCAPSGTRRHSGRCARRSRGSRASAGPACRRAGWCRRHCTGSSAGDRSRCPDPTPNRGLGYRRGCTSPEGIRIHPLCRWDWTLGPDLLLVEYLQPVIDAVADVDLAVMREPHAVDAEVGMISSPRSLAYSPASSDASSSTGSGRTRPSA